MKPRAHTSSGGNGAQAGELRPAAVCRQLLRALDVSEGRRKRRARNTTPDTIGLGIKHDLLEGAVRDDPEAAEFEGWLLRRCLAAGLGDGAHRAMALDILQEWRLAQSAPGFGAWLEQGAPSDDTGPTDFASPLRSSDPR
jgi:hypothetical protein